tara:strand:- start:76334 stop:78073 length:1740 start_codon:yes stop_codon:yes gene_type:complete
LTHTSNLGLIGLNYDRLGHMDNSNPKVYLGLGKVLFNSSVCSIEPNAAGPDVEIFLTERITRVKADGSWPEQALLRSGLIDADKELVISDNRDVKTPHEREEELDKVIPFFNYLKKKNLDQFSSVLNPKIKFVSHHLAHANVAKFMCPFDNAAILVIDGAGSEGHVVEENKGNEKEHEESSVYFLDKGELNLVEKTWQSFSMAKNTNDRWYSEGIGTCYELIAEFIFNSKRAAGKVMGLAAFGKASEFESPLELLNSLNWEKAFKGNSKSDWESSPNMKIYEDLAASVQLLFERYLEDKAKRIKELLPKIENLIIIGGCALNCVSNEKLLQKQIFKNIYVPPNPGDEGIGLGCALASYYEENTWTAFEYKNQHGYFGPMTSVPTNIKVEKEFKNYKLKKSENIIKDTADLLEAGETIAWFQGRSESGPRALGNRSILSRVDRPGLKKYLNSEVKFRESFRPYGCSVVEEKAKEYFEIIPNYPNPFMSFAVPVKNEFKEKFLEVCHVDGTSRIQTVTVGQNQLFYNLIDEVGRRTGLFAVLNTSLNIMGEPILESVEDAKNFFDKSNLKYLVIGAYVVEK